MTAEPIVMICTSDLAGQTRGKGVPARSLADRLAAGVGWTPTNSMITAFGVIAPGPWGPFGDVVLVPDADARFAFDLGGETPETFYMADIQTPEGDAWPACPRGFAKRALDALEARHGLRLRASFEHEFAYTGVGARPNSSYALDGMRRQQPFAGRYVRALAAAGVTPECVMSEFGPRQYEITVAPTIGVAAADQAVAVREIARAVAATLDARASFTPIVDPDGVGNGVHLHFGLVDTKTGAAANFDPSAPHRIDRRAGAFVAGVLAKLPAILALMAPAVISYLRLQPNRWSATHNNLGVQDREAAVRVCPTFRQRAADVADQFHFEMRAADGAASPYLVLGAVAAAGLLGLDQGLATPSPLDGPPAAAAPAALAQAGIAALPTSLAAALDRLEADADVAAMLGPDLRQAYLAHKRFEIDLMAGLDAAALCARYFEVY